MFKNLIIKYIIRRLFIMKKTKILLIAAVVSCMMFSAVACGSRDNEADDNYVTSGGERNTTTNRNNETTTNRNNETTSSKIVGGAGADAGLRPRADLCKADRREQGIPVSHQYGGSRGGSGPSCRCRVSR